MITLYLRKKTFIFLILFIQTFAAFTSLASEADARKKNLVISLLPEMNIFKQKERFELLAAYLSKHLKIEVRLKMLSYDNIIESNTNLHMIG